MIRVIAYTYDAAEHCVDCTMARFASKLAWVEKDENFIPFEVKDTEGNPVHAILSIEETPADLPRAMGGRSLVCDTCHNIIKAHREPR